MMILNSSWSGKCIYLYLFVFELPEAWDWIKALFTASQSKLIASFIIHKILLYTFLERYLTGPHFLYYNWLITLPGNKRSLIFFFHLVFDWVEPAVWQIQHGGPHELKNVVMPILTRGDCHVPNIIWIVGPLALLLDPFFFIISF